jgi:hypothetical protein
MAIIESSGSSCKCDLEEKCHWNNVKSIDTKCCQFHNSIRKVAIEFCQFLSDNEADCHHNHLAPCGAFGPIASNCLAACGAFTFLPVFADLPPLSLVLRP